MLRLQETVPSGPVTVPVDGFPLLSSITNSAGTTLLTVTRANDGTGNITQIADCYGRAVAYQEAAYANQNVPGGYTQSYQELTQVSQVAPATVTNLPSRWAYGYQEVSNTEDSEQVAFLHTITTPSPTGSGTSQAAINYNSTTDLVASVVDGNGNTRSYASTTATGAGQWTTRTQP